MTWPAPHPDSLVSAAKLADLERRAEMHRTGTWGCDECADSIERYAAWMREVLPR